jgi:methylenetetrahydrofolate dehydrogenase (NADP+)/methenyltetrahydrofolate cyclohydrolase
MNTNNEKILNGNLLSQAIEYSITVKLNKLNKILNNKRNFTIPTDRNIINQNYENYFPPPKLKIILVGDRPDSKLYVENKLKMCKSIGIEGDLKLFLETSEKEEILEEIQKSNEDDNIHGIIVQLPLPDKIMPNRTEILSKVDLGKDVDGLNPLNQGKILQMNFSECLLPPTAMGVLELLRLAKDYSNNIDSYVNNYLSKFCFEDHPLDLSFLDVTVIGRGLTAGLPISILMQKCNATVTLCHSKTKNLLSKCENSDILISAVGKSKLVTKEHIKENSIIIDAGINVEYDINNKKIVSGDVDFQDVVDKVKYITPVPGGVGKMTVIMLLKNVIKAWGVINKINFNEYDI